LETVILFARYSPNAANIAVADADLDPGPDEGNDHVLVMLPQQREVAGRDQLAPQVRALYPAIRAQQTPGVSTIDEPRREGTCFDARNARQQERSPEPQSRCGRRRIARRARLTASVRCRRVPQPRGSADRATEE
jgi:hypothetical protein